MAQEKISSQVGTLPYSVRVMACSKNISLKCTRGTNLKTLWRIHVTQKQILLLACLFIGSVALFKVGSSWWNADCIHVYTADEQKKINAKVASNSVEFIYTEQEQRDMTKWKTMDALMIDASTGDRAALYKMGLRFLLGTDLPINVKEANRYFAKSASLGYAPALYEISQTYVNDEPNPFLAFVYLNLTISCGHEEFIRTYHSAREDILSAGKKGQRICDEIERIALQKKIAIIKNQEFVENKQNHKKASWFLSWSFSSKITDEDYQYDADYWLDVYNGDNEVFDLSEIKESDKIYLEKLHGAYYQSISSAGKDCSAEIQKTTEEMAKHSYSNSEIETLKKQARAQAKKNYKFVCKIENDAK